MKKIKFPFLIILSDEDIYFPKDKVWLSEETGYWESNRIYIYHQGLKSREKFGILVHEIVEMLLERFLKFPHKFAHKIANIVEFIVTFGNSTI